MLCAGGVWAGSVQEDVGVETMGTASRGASYQPVEMAYLNTSVYTAMSYCVCVFHPSASYEVLYKYKTCSYFPVYSRVSLLNLSQNKNYYIYTIKWASYIFIAAPGESWMQITGL